MQGTEKYRQLLFSPRDSDWRASSACTLGETLLELGFTGDPVVSDANRYLAGDSFLQSISFMGCSPAIELAPVYVAETGQPDWAKFTFIATVDRLDAISCYFDPQHARPRCYACQKINRQWLTTPFSLKESLICQHCEQAQTIAQVDWKDTGACARAFISVVNIFPREAVPVDAFLQQLAQATGQVWNYSYVFDAIPERDA